MHTMSTWFGIKTGYDNRYDPGNRGLMVPEDPGAEAASPRAVLPKTSALAILVLVAPYGVPLALGTSVANVKAARRRTTRTNKVRLLSSTQLFLQNLVSKALEVGTAYNGS
jgi:hypothetical protein